MTTKQTSSNQVQETFFWNAIHSLKFVIQFFLSSVVMAVCIFQLVRTDVDSESKNVALFWSCITGILALWMPAPSSSSGTSSNQFDIRTVSAPDANVYVAQPSSAQPSSDQPNGKVVANS